MWKFLAIVAAIALVALLVYKQTSIEAFEPAPWKPLLQPDSTFTKNPWTVTLKEGQDLWHNPLTPGVPMPPDGNTIL